MSNGHQAYDLYSPYQFPWQCINFFLAAWIFACLTRCILDKLGHEDTKSKFLALPDFQKRNVVTYVLQFFCTSLALFAQLYGGFDLLFRGDDQPTTEQIQWMTLALLIIVVTYIWEVIYRIRTGFPLLAHHIFTIFLIQLVTASFYDTGKIFYLRFAVILGFHATTEQLSFVALFFYRLKLFSKILQGRLFSVAAAQAFVVKTMVTVTSLVYYAMEVKGWENSSWDIFWKVSTVMLFLGLYVTQVYACVILTKLGYRCHQDKTVLQASNDDTVEISFSSTLEEGDCSKNEALESSERTNTTHDAENQATSDESEADDLC